MSRPGCRQWRELLGLKRTTFLEKMKRLELEDAAEEEAAPSIALAAIKYADLSNSLQKDYVFDAERMTQTTGDTVALSYTNPGSGLKSIVRFHWNGNGVELIDCQQNTRHLASLGAREIPRTQFLHTIARAQHAPCPGWTFDPLYWNALLPPAQAMASPA